VNPLQLSGIGTKPTLWGKARSKPEGLMGGVLGEGLGECSKLL